nr:hypothetical protein [Kibdelosporangium sp. MJ126-NF4]
MMSLVRSRFGYVRKSTGYREMRTVKITGYATRGRSRPIVSLWAGG